MSNERPYVPFYMPYGMTDEEYQYEVRLANEKLAQWEWEQQMMEEQEREERLKEPE